MRSGFYEGLKVACEQHDPNAPQSVAVGNNDEAEKLEAENRKLKYRVVHLTRALNEQNRVSDLAEIYQTV